MFDVLKSPPQAARAGIKLDSQELHLRSPPLVAPATSTRTPVSLTLVSFLPSAFPLTGAAHFVQAHWLPNEVAPLALSAPGRLAATDWPAATWLDCSSAFRELYLSR